jgi:hypothetical protein
VESFSSWWSKIIFEKNPDRQFFVESGIFLDWACPYLEPHGLILKLNRQPLERLTEAMLQRDGDFWAGQIQPMIGGWLRDETTLPGISTFVEKIYGRGDFKGFSGDTNFIKNARAQSMFAGSRVAIARLYDWRWQNAGASLEKERMAHAADGAFRQAWALCPASSTVVFTYVSFLVEQGRLADAVLVTETAASLPQNEGNEQMTQLLDQLRHLPGGYSSKVGR